VLLEPTCTIGADVIFDRHNKLCPVSGIAPWRSANRAPKGTQCANDAG